MTDAADITIRVLCPDCGYETWINPLYPANAPHGEKRCTSNKWLNIQPIATPGAKP